MGNLKEFGAGNGDLGAVNGEFARGTNGENGHLGKIWENAGIWVWKCGKRGNSGLKMGKMEDWG